MTPILSLHNVDVTEFLAVLDTCEGNVYLVTSEGDRLNLRQQALPACRSYKTYRRRQDCRSKYYLRKQK